MRLDAVSYCYPDGQAALQDISVEIAAGTAFGVLGANGAGKSTLLLHLNGLLRGSGTVRVGEWIVAERTLPAIRAAVGLVFQNPDDQLFMPSVAEDVAFGPRNQGLAPIEVQARVQRALEIVGVGNLATRPPHHLSLGQKKRVALATVLAMDCEALLL
ncbi:MAG: ABC transporter ATP-binding protein, partial [Armatimonadetes bacterium]|nr:ABC transporter ATP-binding protein [Armatimonadota bacterium]